MKWLVPKVWLVIFIPILLVSCDTGLGLIETKIEGNVIFVNSQNKPDFVEGVWVIAATNSLFKNPTLSDIEISDRPVNLDQDTSKYEIFVAPGTYVIVAAIWKEKGEDYNYLNILGFYGFDPVHFRYYDRNPVEVAKDHPVAQGYDIICNWATIFPSNAKRFIKNPLKNKIAP